MARRFSLLVADDDATSRNSMGNLLEREGYRVFLAESGLEVIQLAREEEIHGLILDMQMPGLSGLETLRQIREAQEPIPTILISSEPWKEILVEALAEGVFAFMQKPIEEGILRASIAKLLDRCGGEASLRLSIQIYRSVPIEPSKKIGDRSDLNS